MIIVKSVRYPFKISGDKFIALFNLKIFNKHLLSSVIWQLKDSKN